MSKYIEEEFHILFDELFHIDSKPCVEFVDGDRDGNHVWFVYKQQGVYYKATLSWYPHLGYVSNDLSIKVVEPKQKTKVVYE